MLYICVCVFMLVHFAMQNHMKFCYFSLCQIFSMDVYDSKGRSLSDEQLLQQLCMIMEQSQHPCTEPVGLATSLDRDTWAQVYADLMTGHQALFDFQIHLSHDSFQSFLWSSLVNVVNIPPFSLMLVVLQVYFVIVNLIKGVGVFI